MTTEGNNSANGSGTPSNEGDGNNAGGDNNQPQYITIEHLNKALSGFNKQVEQKLSTSLSPLQEILKKLEGDKPQGDKPEGDKPQGDANNPENNKEYQKLQAQLQDLHKKLELADKEKQSKEEQIRQERTKNQVISALTELKIEKPEQVYRLVSDLLVIDESGHAKIKGVDQFGFDEQKDLKTGLSDWLKTEGQHFLPATNVGGSGASSGRGGSGSSNLSLEQLSKMKPSELAKVDLRKVLGEDALVTFFNTNG